MLPRFSPSESTQAYFLVSRSGCVSPDDAAGLSKLSDEARISHP
jgi:hypothetical protein